KHDQCDREMNESWMKRRHFSLLSLNDKTRLRLAKARVIEALIVAKAKPLAAVAASCHARDQTPHIFGQRLMMATLSATFPHRLVIFGFAITSAARFLATVMHRIDGGPGAALGFFLRDATLLVAFLDVLGLTLLFVCVFVFVASWHFLFLLY